MVSERAGSSTLHAWELGIRLRQARTALGMTGSAVAKQIGIAAPNFSSIEAGKRRLPSSKLDELVSIYEIAAGDRDLLQTLRAAAEQRNWWHDYSDLYGEEFLRFLGLEAGTRRIREWAPLYIPGLLQTSEYARAMIRAGSPYIKPVDVGPRLETRLARQTLLDDEPRLQMDVVFGELALRQEVGGAPVLIRQLDSLIERATRPNSTVTLRIVPYAAGAHPLSGAPLTLLNFDNALLPDVIWQETAITGTLIEKVQVIREYSASFEEVFETVALKDEPSLDLVRQIRNDLEAAA